MYEVSKCAPQEALRDLDRAFVNFFENRSRLPRFKSRKQGIGGFRLTGAIRVQGKRAQLPRLGMLRLKEHSDVEGRIVSATVRERAGRWFVSLCVEQSITVPENQGPAIGVDLGIEKLATLSDRTVFDNPRAYRKKLGLLKRAQRTLSRRQKGSRRREWARQCIATVQYRIACMRSDAIHKLTSYLAKTYSQIGIEDLHVVGMLKNHRLAGAISDAAFAEVRRQLAYKTIWYGSEVVVHDRFFPSSKQCSRCGWVKADLVLSERIFHCAACAYTEDRDVNAAMNLCPGVPRALDVDGTALAAGQATAVKPTRLKRQPNLMQNE